MFSSPLLNEKLLKAIDREGFKQPTPVQEKAIPAALERKDLLVSAATGSGKTAAFLLPTLHRLLTDPPPQVGTRALVLLPTRELAMQTLKHFKQLAAFTHLKAGLITGGDDFKYQRSVIRKDPEVLIATPGRLVEHIAKKSTDLSQLEVLILDEADRMLDLGLSEDVLKIVANCNTDRQTLLLSASLNHSKLKGITEQVLRNPEVIAAGGVRNKHQDIQQQVILADDLKHKEKLLARLLTEESYDKALVFTNTRVQADRLGGLVRYHKLVAGVLHGDMTQDNRNHVMKLFRSGSIKVLIASDVAARGLDVKGIELVINFDMARSGDDYAHRIGRTGRAGNQGLAVALVMANEWNLMISIERYLRIKFERRVIPGLKGAFKGPKNIKASGKAAGSKKKKLKKAASNKPSGKAAKARKSASGKQRTVRQTPGSNVSSDGFSPLKRKKPQSKDQD